MVVQSSVGDGKYLEFETLTLAPIDTRPIDPGLLTAAERDWLNAYHRRVFKELSPHLDTSVKSWLAEATKEI
jgi:Xaa-Pro aminopeptidase